MILGMEASPAEPSAGNATGVHGCSDQSGRDVYALKLPTELKRLLSAQRNRQAPPCRTPPGIDVALHFRVRRSCYQAGSARAYIASMAQFVVVDRGILRRFSMCKPLVLASQSLHRPLITLVRPASPENSEWHLSKEIYDECIKVAA